MIHQLFILKSQLFLNNKFAPTYHNIGNAFLSLEMYDSALVYLQKAISLDSNFHQAYRDIALTYHALTRYNEAIPNFLKAIRLEPTKGKVYFELACSYAMSNQPEQAINFLTQAYARGYKNKEALLTDPDLESLKNIKTFQDLLDKYLPDWRNR